MAKAIDGRPATRPGATLSMVAQRVGVSLNTVSRALRAPQTVRPELKRRIEAVLDEIGYVPNRLAGGLAGTRSDLVGVVLTSLYHSEFAAVVESLQATLLERDLQVMLGNSQYDPEQELRILRSILSWRPAALAIVGVDHHPRVVELLQASGIPVVEMWDVGGPFVDSVVGMDHEAIGRAQATHLLTRGCRRLAFVGSRRLHDTRAHKRSRGAELAAQAAGLAPIVLQVEEVAGNPGLGRRLAGALLAAHPDIDGIICNSDVVAFGVLRELQALGRRVPDDVRVIGFGDDEASVCLSPSLTSVRPPRHDIGRTTAELILARLAGKGSAQVTMDWQLMERASTGATAAR